MWIRWIRIRIRIRNTASENHFATAFYLQIWLYCLEETAWWKGAVYPAGTLVRMAGSGTEENRCGVYHAASTTSSIDFGSVPDP